MTYLNGNNRLFARYGRLQRQAVERDEDGAMLDRCGARLSDRSRANARRAERRRAPSFRRHFVNYWSGAVLALRDRAAEVDWIAGRWLRGAVSGARAANWHSMCHKKLDAAARAAYRLNAIPARGLSGERDVT